MPLGTGSEGYTILLNLFQTHEDSRCRLVTANGAFGPIRLSDHRVNRPRPVPGAGMNKSLAASTGLRRLMMLVLQWLVSASPADPTSTELIN